MRAPPALSPEAVSKALQASFGIRVAGLVFLPVGEDSDSWAYRVEAADGSAYFLKVRSGTGPVPGAVVPDYLRRRGVLHCHADLHTWNVLADAEQRLWVVDWDEAILAPKERDLMFVVGGIVHGLVTLRDTESFFQGYGEATVDQRLLAYYRHAWAVQDIAAFAEQAVLGPALSPPTRDAAVDGFEQLFEPGNIVDLALRSEGGGW